MLKRASKSATRSRPMSKPQPKKKQGRGGGPRQNQSGLMLTEQRTLSVPAQSGALTRNQVRYSFGAAPYSSFADTTGLRLVFRALYGLVYGNVTNANVLAGTGGTSTANGSSKINPFTALAAGNPGFPALITNIAENFGLWRFRKLAFEFVTSSPSTSTVHIGMGFTRSTSELASTPALVDVSVMQRNVEFPAWSVEPVALECIQDQDSQDKDSPLFSIAASEGGMGQYQGALSMSNNQTAATPYGYLYVTGMLDLYCPTNNTGAALARAEKKCECAILRRPSRPAEELKAESSDSELVELREPPFIRSGNSSHSANKDLSFTPANTPAGSKRDVKTTSLK